MRISAITLAVALLAAPAGAAPIQWVDWTSSVSDNNGFTATGVITSGA